MDLVLGVPWSLTAEAWQLARVVSFGLASRVGSLASGMHAGQRHDWLPLSLAACTINVPWGGVVGLAIGCVGFFLAFCWDSGLGRVSLGLVCFIG